MNITEVGKHLADNPSHIIEFSNVRVLGFERNTRKRRVLESLFIQDSMFNHKLLNDNMKSNQYHYLIYHTDNILTVSFS